MEVQTIHPARHFNEYIQMNASTTENPNAAKSHYQFYFKSLMKFPKVPELLALDNFSTAVFKTF